MTAMNGRSLPTLPVETPATHQPARLGVARHEMRRPDRLVFALPLAAAILGMAVGIWVAFSNDLDLAIAPVVAFLAGATLLATAVQRARSGTLDRVGAILGGVALAALVAIAFLPTWLYGANVNGIIHRTVISGPVLLVLATGSAAHATRRLFGGTPSGQDLAMYPIFAVPIVLGMLAYGIVLGRILVAGLGTFRLDLMTTAWRVSERGVDVGFLNNILGTLLLIVLTLLIAILPGIGSGVFMSEYPGRLAGIVRFCSSMLRAIAMFIIGAAAFGMVRAAGVLDSGGILSGLIRGGFDDGSRIQPERGSFILAATFLAILVMPVIARLTEEGLRSVPREIREGTVALGATEGYGLRRILLPWAAPNIVTALLLAGAEAAGSLAIIMFLAVPGQNGVGPFSGVTTLDYAVFATRYGPREYFESMRDYQNTAALLLLVLTMGLTLFAMALQRRFARRYRGSITAD
jgi:phosphate transport system permease protein